MSDRSNVAAEISARLARAREHYDLGIECYRAAADEILSAKRLDEKLSNRAIARATGLDHTTVGKLLKWRESGADRTTSPFGGDHKRLDRALRQAIDERPDEVVRQLAGKPELVNRILAASIEDLGDLPEPATEPDKGPPVLQVHDTVRMGEHVLIVGDSERPGSKLRALIAAGLPFAREFYDRDAVEEASDSDGEMDVVVVTDPPYGQKKRGITNDHIANWAPVYSLFKPRGGFVFCAYHPPFFREAEDGIIQAGGRPVEYLALDKGGGRIWGGDRVQNRLDAIIYFERAGAPWPSGRHAVSLLVPERGKEARDERREIGGGHLTPKYIDILVRLIGLCTEPGGTVLDPFTGSGTTLIACQRTGRRFIGLELEPEWADLTVKNWQRETGRDAVVSREFGADEVTFDALKADPTMGDGPAA